MIRSRRVLMGTLVAVTAAVVLGLSSPVLEAQKPKKGRAHSMGTVFVSSQGLYYDTFVSAEELPPHGPFQLLINGVTEFGPGDPGYLGGRWQVPDPTAEGGYRYFLCPLLGPGRPNP